MNGAAEPPEFFRSPENPAAKEQTQKKAYAVTLNDFTAPKQELKQLAAQLLQFHPLANAFPLMRGKDFDVLVADVKAYGGLREKIMLYQGKILDGRNRYRACLQARIEPQFEQFEGTEAEARAHVNRANLFRLHLKPKEKRVRMDTAIKAAPEKSDRQIAEEIGADHKTIGAARTKLERRGEIPHVAKRRDTKGREQPAKRNTAKKPAPVSAEVEKIRNEAAARIRGLLGNNEPAAPPRQGSGEVGDDRGADHGADPGVDGGGNSRQDGSLEGDHDLDDDRPGDDHGHDGDHGHDADHGHHRGGGDGPARGDSGAHSIGEAERLRRNEELENENASLKLEIEDLKIEIEDLKAALQKNNASKGTNNPSSRTARWKRWTQAATAAGEALRELSEIQQEYESQRDNLPENFRSSTLGGQLDAVCELELNFEDALGIIEEAENLNLPGMG